MYLTGVLKNRFLTVIVVPFEHPISSNDKISPPSTTILFPICSVSVLLTSSTFAIAAILANASPLNPIDFTVSRSSAFLILLVAWRSNASSTSSFAIPFPLSVILINEIPPFFISIVT